jgi:hypothetical protein
MLTTANARKVSGLQFLDAIGLDSPERREMRAREMREQCIRAIEAGDTYGWPPSMVADCRKGMERADLTPKELPNGRFQVAA